MNLSAARGAGVKHFIWSTLPNVEEISGGRFHVPHFTGKARIDRIVREAGFASHTFVIAPMYYQSLLGVLALGAESSRRIALANVVAGHPPTSFANWARANFPAQIPVAAGRY